VVPGGRFRIVISSMVRKSSSAKTSTINRAAASPADLLERYCRGLDGGCERAVSSDIF
jgi:hypothetical protein